MFKTIVFSLCLLIGISANAQSKKGINFQSIDLEAAKQIAKKENKLIFIDIYTTWCGPCKLMQKNTFTDPKVGELFNKSFVNLAIDAEKEGVALAKEFKIVNLPSFLFLDATGKLVQYDFGYYNAEQFSTVGASVLSKVSSGMAPKTLDMVKGKMVGDKIADFSAKDHLGKTFSSSKEKEKLILVFIRGQWCPYCNKYIESLQNLSQELKAKNARLVIISPEKPEFIEKTLEKTKTGYTVLYDEGYKIAEAFDVLYTPDSKTLAAYTSKVDGFTTSRSDNSGRLPVSATYILDENKVISWRHFNPDYKERASAEDILKQL
ncbi:peroxiredoxin-like family protein [Chryseobacterium limigenitum]|uniref:Peroxiredoxin n=1 Tax=Chryseobacterium limigenitum TaxID=1612149 RepID=A0A1K2IVJ2_9FLAO|nr:peroxiredoxin-like family protein [Chryseobacterium limigenitum]SFZ95771.1 Peroxiredoxin [Chryseobacterium limigenitum]